MSRLVVQVTHRQESTATAIVDLRPGQPVRYGDDCSVVDGVLKLERPLPLGALVRQVLMRYGLEMAAEGETDRMPREAEELCAEPERRSLRA